MLGCVIGDLHGSLYEAGRSPSRALEPLTPAHAFTDDTVCTMAVIDHLLHELDIQTAFRTWARAYPNAGYGRTFRAWVLGNGEPIASWGNGALMRISPVVLLSPSLDVALERADHITCATHNHPVSRRSVRQYIELMWQALEGATKDELLEHWTRTGGGLHRIEDMRAKASPMRLRCDDTLEDVLSCLAESDDFDSLIGNCLYHGGDSDTIAAIAGPLGELLWGVPAARLAEFKGRADQKIATMVEALYECAHERAQAAPSPSGPAAGASALARELDNADWDRLHELVLAATGVAASNARLQQVLLKVSLPVALTRESLRDPAVKDQLAEQLRRQVRTHASLDAWLDTTD